MPKSKGRAGRNIRLLAFSRRYKAVYAFVGAGFVVYMPFALAKLIEGFRSLFVDSNPDLAESPAMPVVIYGVAIALAIYLVINGVRLWKGANRADQGAKGEEDVANELRGLAASGWQIEYGQRLGKGLGDIDIICSSPSCKTYAIDVKSHRCSVVTDGKKLYRRMGKQQYPFEKDFLSQVMKQALQVKKKKGAKFVTPIVVFSNARVAIPSNKVKHVYVVEKSRLAALLQSLG
ncbi:MAG: nuclease-related domain-containing protein [Cyanobacteria bacterium P01_A01_bin.137]